LTYFARWNSAWVVQAVAPPVQTQIDSPLPFGSGAGFAKVFCASSCGDRAADAVT
jgi:hypothetical protein